MLMPVWEELPASHASGRFFVSYRSSDSGLASELAALLSNAGAQVWRDRDVMHAGDDWRAEIARGIDWAEDVILLLTPAAADSAEVRNEVNLAREAGRRLQVFASFDFRAHPIYALIQDLHIERIDPFAAAKIVESILRPIQRTHPMSNRDFARLFSRRLLTHAETLSLGAATAAQYRDEASVVDRTNACLGLNRSFLFASSADWDGAVAAIDAVSLDRHPLLPFYRSLFLLRGKRPAQKSAGTADAAINLAQRAYAACRTPLLALHLTLLVWDLGNRRGANVASFLKNCAEALAENPRDREEIPRYLEYSAVSRGLEMPFDRESFVRFLRAMGGE